LDYRRFWRGTVIAIGPLHEPQGAAKEEAHMTTKTFAWLGRGLVVSASLVLASLAGGCVETDLAPERPEVPAERTGASESDQVDLHDSLVGTWRFVYTPERRAEIEAMLAEKVTDPAALETAKREAEEEASASEVEFTADREYISRIGDKVIFTAKYEAKATGATTLSLTQADSDLEIRVDLGDDDSITMHDPKKGALRFVRK
jgi:hypothetical protein